MERGKRIENNPIDEAVICKDYYHDIDLGWMPTKEYLDSILKPLMTNENGFKKEVDKMMLLGVSETQAGCYISNYHDDYICDAYNGGCKSKIECEAIYNKLCEKERCYEPNGTL